MSKENNTPTQIKVISFIVCSNGFGHLKRVFSVIDALQSKKQQISINIFCSEKHYQFIKNQKKGISYKNISFITTTSTNEIQFAVSNFYTLEKYKTWAATLAKNKVLQKSDLIISDNHIAPARVFDNVILMGSFLWHSLHLFDNPVIKEISKQETNFLKSNKLNMLCLKSMAMDAVKNQTNPIQLSWFCKKYPNRFHYPKNNNVLITGGGTALLNNKLMQLCEILQKTNKQLNIYIDGGLNEVLKNNPNLNIKKFDFSNKSFSSLSLIICRPGIGILTDSVRYCIPTICIHDNTNKEIAHNAIKIEEMGLGKSFELKYKSSLNTIAQATNELVKNKEQLTIYQQKLNAQKTGGANQAANYILSKLFHQ